MKKRTNTPKFTVKFNKAQELIINGQQIKRDAEGRYNLNSIHKIAMEQKVADDSQQPNGLTKTDTWKNLIPKIVGIKNPVISKAGRYGGTYAVEELAIEYAGWISPEFKLVMINTFREVGKAAAKGVAIKAMDVQAIARTGKKVSSKRQGKKINNKLKKQMKQMNQMSDTAIETLDKMISKARTIKSKKNAQLTKVLPQVEATAKHVKVLLAKGEVKYAHDEANKAIDLLHEAGVKLVKSRGYHQKRLRKDINELKEEQARQGEMIEAQGRHIEAQGKQITDLQKNMGKLVNMVTDLSSMLGKKVGKKGKKKRN